MTVECQAGTWQWTLEAEEESLTAELLLMKKNTCVPAEWKSLEKGGSWQPGV